jgi:glycosyltransferase involved in cell wall biosynthesis
MLSVTVVMPTYNGTAFVAEALDSVFAQTLLPQEIVVVDDCSSDGTPDLVETIAAKSPVPLRLIRLTKNSGGPARPLNVGIEAARGELIAVLDQDDVFLPTKLQEQVHILTENPQLVFACGLCGSIADAVRPRQRESFLQQLMHQSCDRGAYRELPGRASFELLIGQGQYLIGYPAFVFRRASWLQKGGANEKLQIASDYDFLCWLSLQGPIAFTPKVCYLRRNHPDNLSCRPVEGCLDLGRVRAIYIQRERWLLDDPVFREQLRDELLGYAYWLREAGHHAESMRVLFLVARLWGTWGRPAAFLIKLLPHWVAKKMGFLWRNASTHALSHTSAGGKC